MTGVLEMEGAVAKSHWPSHGSRSSPLQPNDSYLPNTVTLFWKSAFGFYQGCSTAGRCVLKWWCYAIAYDNMSLISALALEVLRLSFRTCGDLNQE